MVPKRRIVEREGEGAREHAAPAVVLPFPLREKPSAEAAAETGSDGGAGKLPAMPSHGERPTHATHSLREWLRAALIVSLAVHVIVYLAFQWRIDDDVERAAGAAAALASDGSTTVLVEILTTAALPSAPSPADANDTEAVTPVPNPQRPAEEPRAEPIATRAEIEKQVPLLDPAIVPPLQAAPESSPRPEPATMRMQETTARVALPVEEMAPSTPVATSNVPETPAAVVRQPAKPPQEPREQKQSAQATPSRAASPSQAAGANSAGRAGAGGIADAGGQAAVSSYQAQVLAHLARHRVYPPEARSRGVTGIARVQFALARDGRVISARLVGGSGERILDEAAVAMVQRASPFPPFPPAITQASMNFAAPIRFDLR